MVQNFRPRPEEPRSAGPRRLEGRPGGMPSPFAILRDAPARSARVPRDEVRGVLPALINRPELLPLQPQQLRRILLEDQRAHLGSDVDLLEVRHPAVGRERRIVGAEQHLLAQQRVGVMHQNRREVFRRPAGEVDVDVGLVLTDRERLLLPGERGVRDDDLHLGKIDRNVVDVHRIGIFQADAPAPRHARADPGLAAVKERDRALRGDRLVEHIRAVVVGIEALGRGMELEPLDAEIAHQAARLLGAGATLGWIDRGERDHDIAVLVGDAGDLLVRVAAVTALLLAVDREDHAADLALAIIVGDRRRRELLALVAEIGPHRLALGALIRIERLARRMGVGVDVDRDQGIEIPHTLSFQLAVCPPSTGITAPLMYDAASDATKAMTLAISRGCAKRPLSTRGRVPSGSLRLRATYPFTRSVKVRPGQIALARRPCCPYSTQSWRVKPMMPALLAA